MVFVAVTSLILLLALGTTADNSIETPANETSFEKGGPVLIPVYALVRNIVVGGNLQQGQSHEEYNRVSSLINGSLKPLLESYQNTTDGNYLNGAISFLDYIIPYVHQDIVNSKNAEKPQNKPDVND